jgi:hypothetical protein
VFNVIKQFSLGLLIESHQPSKFATGMRYLISFLSFLLGVLLFEGARNSGGGRLVLVVLLLVNTVVYIPQLKLSQIFQGFVTILIFIVAEQVGF